MAFNRDLSQLANFLEVNSDGTFISIIPPTSQTNLGIGTNNPTAKLDVLGNARVSGNLSATNINASGIVTATSGFVGALTGLASSATQLATGRTIAITGDLAYTSGSFNGTDNVTGTGTLATVNSNVGSFGSQTLIPVVTVNAKGLVTSVTTAAVAVGTALTVTGDSGSENINLLTETLTISGGTNLTSSAASNTVTVNLDPNISLTSIVASGVVTATSGFSGNVSGNLTGEVNSPSFDTNASGVVVTGITTSSSGFVGNLTGNLTGNINSSGVSTVTSLNATNINASGIVTATSGFVGNVTGTATSTTNIPNLSGDITSANTVTTLATVNSNVGSFGSQTLIPVVTVNAKGLVTAVTTAAVGTALTVTGDSGSENIDLLSESLTISGGTNLTSSAASNTVTVNLDPNISLTSVVASGVITATSGFVGALTGNVTGNINSSGVSTVASLNATNINTSGIVTAAQFVTGASGSAIGINTNTISGPATITIDPAGVGDNTGLVVIKGDLQIDGTTTTINSTTVTIDDKNIQIADGAANDAAADGAGFTITSGDGNKTFQFQDAGDNLGSSENLNVAVNKVYKISNTEVLSSTTLGSGVVNSSLTSVGTLTKLSVGNVNSSGIVTATTFVGALTGNVTGNINSSGVSTVTSLNATNINASGIVTATSGFVGNLTGLASSATQLATGRTIAITGDLAYTSGSFDGTGNVTGTGTLATVNSNVGSFGSQTLIPVVTVNAKGLVTAVTTAAVGSGLTVAGDSGSENINLLTETLTISGGTNLTSSAASNTVTVNLDPNISLTSVVASGVITATSGFSGNVSGNLTGEVNAAAFDTNASGVVVTGIATATTFVGALTGNVTGNINSSGVSTVTSLNATNINVSGVSTFVGNAIFQSDIKLGDNDKIIFGDSTDLQIYHDGTDSRIVNGTGDLYLKNEVGKSIIFQDGVSEVLAQFTSNGSVKLYHNNSEKFETTGYGATVFGTLESQQLNVTGVSTVTSLNATNINASGIVTATSGFSGNLTGNITGNINSSGVSTVTSLNATNINASGIVTATSGFSGNVTGNLTGNITGNINSSGVSTVTSLNATNINASGIVTATSGFSGNVTGNVTGNINSSGVSTVTSLNATNINASGIVTATSGFSGNVTGNVTGNINSSGVSTVTSLNATNINASGIVTATSGFSGNLTGLASSATQLATGRTIAITGDLAYTSGSFDGTGNVTGTGTLATVNSNVGSFGSQTLIPVVTVNAKGLVTAVTTAAVGSGLTVTGDSGSENINLLTETLTISGGTNLTSSAASNTVTVNLDPNISLTSVVASGVITATSGFVGNVTGTATSTTNIPNLTGAITSINTTTSLGSFSSANLATALTDETGTGSAVFATSPTLVTPVLGDATATSIVVGSGVTINASGINASAGIVTASRFVSNVLTGTAPISVASSTRVDNLNAQYVGGFAAPTSQVIGSNDTQTLTNKTIALGSNTITGTLAEFNTSLTDADFVSIGGTETLTNKTLTSPVLTTPTLGTATATSINVSGIVTATQFVTGASGSAIGINTNTISGPATITIDPAGVGDNTGAVRIKGDLFVDGTQFIVNSTTIELADFVVGIASTATTDILADGAGIKIGPDNTLTYDHTNTSLKSSENFNLASGKTYKINGTDVLSNNTLASGVVNSSLTSVGTLINLSVGNINSSGIVTATSGFSGNVTGNITGNINSSGVSTVTSLNATNINASGIVTATSGFVGALTGLASSATQLATGRTIAITGDLAYTSGSFDGTGNVTGTGTLATVNSNVGSFGSQTLIPVVTVNAKGLVTSVTTAAVGTALTVTGDSGSENIDLLSETLTISGGTNLTSSAASNTVTVNLDPNISLTSVVASGVVTATSGFSGNVTGNVTGNLTGNVTGNINSSGVSTVTSLNATNINASGIVTATSGFVGNLTGLASSATQLATGRTVAITGDLTYTSGSFNGTGDVTGTGTLATVNSNVGSFGSQTLIPVVTVNAKGLVTAVTTAAVGTALTVTGDSGSENIDLLSETLTISGGTNLTSSAASNTVTVNLDPNISLTSVVASGVITATSGFSGNLTGEVNAAAFDTNASGVVVTGVTTSTSGFVGALTGNVTGNINSSGVSTVTNLNIGGYVSIGNTIGVANQVIASTGVGVTWKSFNDLLPQTRTTQTFTATANQTVFSFVYNVNFLDVFVNGVKLSSGEFTASNGTSITLSEGAFANDNVEFVSYATLGAGTGQVSSLNDLTDVTLTGITTGNILAYNGSEFVNTSTLSNITALDATTTATIETAIAAAPNNFTSLNISGVSTVTSLIATNINASGIVTATSGFVGNLTGTASTTTNIPNLTGAITSNNTTTSLGSFSSSNLATALTDETGSGSAVFSISPTFTGTVGAAAITATGDIAAANFNSTSDINLKENIKQVESASELVSKLEGVHFSWKETGKETIGVIAQQIEEHLPQLVQTGDTHKTVNYNGLIGVLIEAVKEQGAQIAALQAEIEELKK
jgi:hypothetical protein